MVMEIYLGEDESDNLLKTNVLSSAIEYDSTTRAAVTVGLVIAFLLMVAFFIDC